MSFSGLFILLVMVAIVYHAIGYSKFKRSEYGKISGNGYFKTRFNTGNYGEYLTFSYLETLPESKRLVTNVYIPKNDGTTTEIDLIMLNSTGVYVFESKNYSGWIFGDDRRKEWTQTLKGGKKNKFFNPVWQNKAHIRALENILSEISSDLFYSYIVFSERCELKNVSVTSPGVSVIKRNQLLSVLQKDLGHRSGVFTNQVLDNLFETLQKYSLVDNDVKRQHIQDLKSKHQNI